MSDNQSTEPTMNVYPPDPSRTLTIDPDRGTTCGLCGHYSTDSTHWFEAWSPFNYRTYVEALSLIERLGLGDVDADLDEPGNYTDLAAKITELIDPVEAKSDNDWDIVCLDCLHATPEDLTQRISAYADRLDNACRTTCCDDSMIADGDMYHRSLWVRRHVGITLNVHTGPFLTTKEMTR